jgi:resuscitation-promoting factor RpfB
MFVREEFKPMNKNMKVFSGLLQKKKLFMSILSIVVLVAVSGIVIFEMTKKGVTLVVNGEEIQIKSHAETVEELLVDNDITAAVHDKVNPSLDTTLQAEMEIVYKAAKSIVLTRDNEQEKKWTTEETVGEFLKANSIEVKEHDQIKPALNTKITENMQVAYKSAFQVPLAVGAEQEKVWTTSTTVADLLKQHDVTLGELDRVEPGLEREVTPKTIVSVIRVEKVTDVVEEEVDYATVTKKDSSLTTGKQKVVEEGEKGQIEKSYEVVLENGKEVSRKLLKETTVKESSDRIVAVGTKPVQTVSRNKSQTVKNEFYVTSTAYTASCTGCSGITTTGVNLKANPGAKVIAVDPNIIPLGTKVYVEGYGYAVAADTGGAIKGNKIDVFVPTKSQAYSWGRKTVRIKILN